MNTYRIGQIATKAGVNVDTLRYYERRGLVQAPKRSDAGYRIYDGAALSRVRFIKRAQSLGFSLNEVMELLEFDGSDEATAGDVMAVAERKIEACTTQIQELERLRSLLTAIVDECPGDESPSADCPILKFLQTNEG